MTSLARQIAAWGESIGWGMLVLGLSVASLESLQRPEVRSKPPEERRAPETLVDREDELEELLKTKIEVVTSNSAGAAGEPLIRTIFVNLGPPRSEVFVSGRRVGETPYVGQWSCRDRDQVKVIVVPKKGLPIEGVLRCSGSRVEATTSTR